MNGSPLATRIAHIADPHLPFGLPQGLEWVGKRGLSGLSWRLRRGKHHRAEVADALIEDLCANPHDVVAMTGDLINFGLPREFRQSADWLARLGPPEDVVAIPGNHEALAGAWEAAMQQNWGDYAWHGRMFTHADTALIAVSSACVTPPFFASGGVTREALGLLRSQLTDARASNLVPIVLIHHPPTPITKRRKALANLEETAAVLAEGGASLVLHGHNHRRDLSWIDAPHGRIPVLGAPSLSMAPGLRQPAGAWRSLLVQRSADKARVEVTERTVTSNMELKTRTPVVLSLPILA